VTNRSLILLAACAALALPGTAAARPAAGAQAQQARSAAQTHATATPTGLRGFLLRANEPVAHVFPRTPSFTWNPVRRPGVYQFQLAMSRTFDESQILFQANSVPQPAIAVPLQLPWMTGQPYALWAHVRFVSSDGHVGPWSEPFGFDMRWRDADVPTQMPAPAGLVRWQPVDGATAYEVLYSDMAAARSFYTTTNVADEREYWTFHQSLALASIRWRVRAIRYIDDQKPLPNGLPQVSYGPWSATFTSVNPPSSLAAGPLTPAATVSDQYDRAGQPVRPHDLMPAFSWTGAAATPGLSVGSPLYRVYISTDDHCVNTVFVGPVVGSPAYAPRISGGPLSLPQNTKDLATWQSGRFKLGGSEGNVFGATGDPLVTNETPAKPVGSSTAAGAATSGVLNGNPVARTDLWDSGWPNGRYFWTVVPVTTLYSALASDSTAQKPVDSLPIEYHDANVPQDACEAGRMMSFGKVSEPVVTAASSPYVSGVSPTGRMVAAVKRTPAFHATPLVAWQPATGAQTYEVQWSKQRYPWRPAGSITTPATSIVLPLKKPAVWYYKVRGINPSLPAGAQNMTWSAPVGIKISGNVWTVVR
jgi:hypothetical protein